MSKFKIRRGALGATRAGGSTVAPSLTTMAPPTVDCDALFTEIKKLKSGDARYTSIYTQAAQQGCTWLETGLVNFLGMSAIPFRPMCNDVKAITQTLMRSGYSDLARRVFDVARSRGCAFAMPTNPYAPPDPEPRVDPYAPNVSAEDGNAEYPLAIAIFDPDANVHRVLLFRA